jgi:hypothetical protein
MSCDTAVEPVARSHRKPIAGDLLDQEEHADVDVLRGEERDHRRDLDGERAR